ncbi:hypothetical protein V6N13_048137 [Hibiscus sabdariffa]
MLDWWERYLFNTLMIVLMWFVFYNSSRYVTEFCKRHISYGLHCGPRTLLIIVLPLVASFHSSLALDSVNNIPTPTLLLKTDSHVMSKAGDQ